MQLVASTPSSKPVPAAIQDAINAVSPDELRSIVERISRPRVRGSAENREIRQAIAEMLAAAWDDDGRITLDDAGNVVAGDPGRAKILVGAHYDSVPGTPGADDNASAVAALIELARAIGPRDDVGLVAFDGEECGFVGSRALVDRLGSHRPEQIHVLEMVGYASKAPGSQRNPIPGIPAPTIGDFLAVVGTHRSRALLDHVLAAADAHPVPVQALYLPDVPLAMIEALSHHLLRSDHAPFWRAGLAALMWTDTAEFRNPHYHQATDTPGTLDYDFLAGVTRLLVHTVLAGIGGDRDREPFLDVGGAAG